jgi:hypothetical protein
MIKFYVIQNNNNVYTVNINKKPTLQYFKANAMNQK